MKKCFLLLSIMAVLLLVRCKEEEIEPVEITTEKVTDITRQSAIVVGGVDNDRGKPIKEFGICWSIDPSPTIEHNKKMGSGNYRIISLNVSELTENTTYYVRVYAINEGGIGYGEVLSFTTLKAVLAQLKTNLTSQITISTALSGGEILSNGGATVTEEGICWATYSAPTIASNKIVANSVNTSFTAGINNLTINTKYYVRSYAITSAGVAYGNEVVFSTPVKDVDGNQYDAVTIGTYIWMSENLHTEHFSNGDLINTTPTPTQDISNESDPKYQWNYNGDEFIGFVYGRLYTWHVATDTRNVCPSGWHVPTLEDWKSTGKYVGDAYEVGGKLKEVGVTHWQTPNANATDEFKFSAMPSGLRTASGEFKSLNQRGVWWSSTALYAVYAEDISFSYASSSLFSNSTDKKTGHAIRCIRD